ncbi:hypothetical protein FNV43_RR08494 [Rhamnella rubrinervis]|uniref:Uncharacterized protein n=1 Tax=Rhamnella rubrinervis TaxID=2594499 RepID=A0A8K0H8Q3_9ROSA|nr:hypothetical protein FNV43_RR08494 [Rhamnella rubrinervis]
METLSLTILDVNCKTFVHNLKQRYGSGISSLCMIFNATGSTLTYVSNKDWHGQIYESPYPSLIQNGQWKDQKALLYIAERTMLEFNLTGCLLGVFPVLVIIVYIHEIREVHHYETDHWGYIKGLLESKPTNYIGTWSGCYSAVTIGRSTSPEYVGIMSLDGVISELSYAVFMSLAANSAIEDSAIEESASEDKEDE